ncbi:hypothetical protein [Amycolatopsis sp.]|uniref:hypothetical protein n=1 Tax=Amycolatopsis sp. TaxID=37632 RepID=UPI002D7F2FFC|nr:hypothetical protein [Amycolatopsis sp.]HET6707243.1 hypothetical protein [Amycolatopsis sp.]
MITSTRGGPRSTGAEATDRSRSPAGVVRYFDTFDSGGRMGFRRKSLWRNAFVVNTTPTRFGDYPNGGKGNRGITIRLPERDRLDIGGGAGEH